MKEENLCVLIDFENIAAGTEKAKLGRFDIRLVMNRLKEKGRILVTRAYGDWGRFAKFKQSLLEQGVGMMELTSYRGQDKNRADIALVVDAMELVYTRDYISTFVLLSGDSDFTPLAMRLKELNKRVIGLGTKGSTSRLLAESCDEFIFYESLLRRSKPTPPKAENTEEEEEEETTTPLNKEEAVQILIQTIEGIQKDRPGPMSAGFLKQSIMRKHSTFDEGEFGFTGFTAFLKDSQKSKLITLLKDPRSQGFQVDMFQSEIDDIQLSEIPDMSTEARKLWDKLISIEINPTTHMVRHTVVHELVDHVSERMAKKKRNSLRYVYSDIQRRCRKTDPPISATDVRHIIEATQLAGLLLHPNGDPVRSENAQFIIKHDAEALLIQLREYYIQQLLNTGEALDNFKALSELLWGDDQHVDEATEIVSWLKFEDGDISAKETSDKTPPSKEETSAPSPKETVTTPPKAKKVTKEEPSSAISEESKESKPPKKKVFRRKKAPIKEEKKESLDAKKERKPTSEKPKTIRKRVSKKSTTSKVVRKSDGEAKSTQSTEKKKPAQKPSSTSVQKKSSPPDESNE
jgi:uncharacterized protein (TIGR00288 family)